MRILHTSDWHLGRTLEDRSRDDEQEAVLEEICAVLDDQKVDLVLVAGDVFDSVNPPAVAEQLFYDALERMSQGGRRAVVVIAGNHDSPERLVAANPLAARFGISILGLPGDCLLPQPAEPGLARRLATAPSYLELSIPGVPHPVAIAALPYPSEARLGRALPEPPGERARRQAFSDRVGGLLSTIAATFKEDAVNLVASHLFVDGALESDSERPIQLGGACAVSPAAFPAAHYVALGHLHKPQAVAQARCPVRYSGSPLACGFAEAGQQKSVVLIDAEPGRPVRLQTVDLHAGRPLVRWNATEGLAQALRWCEQGRDREAWIDLTLHLTAPLSMSEVQTLRSCRERLVHIRPVLPAAGPGALETRAAGRPLDETFRAFCRARLGAEPDGELVSLFVELVCEDPTSSGSTPPGREEAA